MGDTDGVTAADIRAGSLEADLAAAREDAERFLLETNGRPIRVLTFAKDFLWLDVDGARVPLRVAAMPPVWRELHGPTLARLEVHRRAVFEGRTKTPAQQRRTQAQLMRTFGRSPGSEKSLARLARVDLRRPPVVRLARPTSSRRRVGRRAARRTSGCSPGRPREPEPRLAAGAGP